MKITSTEVYERNHTTVLSKSDVERLLRDAVLSQLKLTIPEVTIRYEWGETSIDSGLGKEPQIIVRVKEFLRVAPDVRSVDEA